MSVEVSISDSNALQVSVSDREAIHVQIAEVVAGTSTSTPSTSESDIVYSTLGTKTFTKAELRDWDKKIVYWVSTSNVTWTLPNMDAGDTTWFVLVHIESVSEAEITIVYPSGATGTVYPAEEYLFCWDTTYLAWRTKLDQTGADAYTRASYNSSTSELTLFRNTGQTTIVDLDHLATSGSNVEIVTTSKTYNAQETRDLDGKEIWTAIASDISLSFAGPSQDVYFRVLNMSNNDSQVTLTSNAATRREELFLEKIGEEAAVLWDNNQNRFEFNRIERDFHPASQVEVVELNNSSTSSLASGGTHIVDLDDNWDSWRGKRVVFTLSDAILDNTINIQIRPNESGAWLPSKGTHEQQFNFTAAQQFGGSSFTIQPANADRPEITVDSLKPDGATRYFARLILNQNGSIQLNMSHDRVEAGGSADDDLSESFEMSGRLVLKLNDSANTRSGTTGDTLEINFTNADTSEPYLFTPSNSAEVTRFTNKYRRNTSGGDESNLYSGSITLIVFNSEAAGQTGDEIRFEKLWDKGEFQFSFMQAITDLDKDAFGLFDRSADAKALDKQGLPFSLVYTGAWDGGATPPWIIRGESHATAIAAHGPIVEQIDGNTRFQLKEKFETWKNRKVYLSLKDSTVFNPRVLIEEDEQAGNRLESFNFPAAWFNFEGGDTAYPTIWWEPPKGSRPQIDDGQMIPGNTFIGRIELETRGSYFNIVLTDSQQADIPARGVTTSNSDNVGLSAAMISRGNMSIYYNGAQFNVDLSNAGAAPGNTPWRFQSNRADERLYDQDWIYTVGNTRRDTTQDARVVFELPGSTTPTAYLPASTDPAFIDFYPLGGNMSIALTGMNLARISSNGETEYFAASTRYIRPARPSHVPFRLVYPTGEKYRNSSLSRYDWLVHPLAPELITSLDYNLLKNLPEPSESEGGDGEEGSRGAFDTLRREESVAQSLPSASRTVVMGGASGYTVDSGATHLDVEVVAPSDLNKTLTWYYVDAASSTDKQVYDSDGNAVTSAAGSTVSHRFSSVFFATESGSEKLKIKLRNDVDTNNLTGGALSVNLTHEKDVNSSSVGSLPLLENDVVAIAQTPANDLVGATVSTIEFESYVEFDNLVSITIDIGTTSYASEDASRSLTLSKAEIEYLGFWDDATDSLANSGRIKGTFGIGWISTGTTTALAAWSNRPDAEYVSYYHNTASISSLPSRIICFAKDGAYLTGLRVAAFRFDCSIKNVTCMRKI